MSTDDNLEKTLMDLWVTDPHEVAYTIVVPEAKASIKAESLRIALEIIEHTELRDVYSKADSTEKAIPQLKVNYRNQFRQAFEDRYSK